MIGTAEKKDLRTGTSSTLFSQPFFAFFVGLFLFPSLFRVSSANHEKPSKQVEASHQPCQVLSVLGFCQKERPSSGFCETIATSALTSMGPFLFVPFSIVQSSRRLLLQCSLYIFTAKIYIVSPEACERPTLRRHSSATDSTNRSCARNFGFCCCSPVYSHRCCSSRLSNYYTR